MNNGLTQEHNGGTLAMVVWLRGDEEEFTLSAEDVMAALDIKRSRLTQISGRELRVGRRRVDRYLKPFYRPADVHSYQERTRAALTRQRSAAAVSSVADDIETRHKTLLQETTAQLRATLADTSRTIQKNLSELLHSTQTKTSSLITADSFLQKNKILRGMEALARQGRRLLVEFEQQTAALHDRTVQQMQEILHTQHEHTLQTLQSATAAQMEAFTVSDAAHIAQLLTLQQSSADMARQLLTLQQSSADIARQLLTLQQSSADIAQQLCDMTARHAQELQALHALVNTKISGLEDIITQELHSARQAVPVRVWASMSP